MNLVMRGIRPANIITRNGDTLEDDWPLFDDEDPSSTYHLLPVDAVVSNPPYSQQWNPEGKANDPRYSAFGLAPKSKADYAFLLHDLYHLKADGVMTIVLPHGVLFRGNEEGQIRRQLIERGHIEAIIGLPANIFFGTGIPTIIMVLRQKRADSDVLIVDASKGFEKAGKNNRLRERDIRKVVDAVTSRATIEGFSRLVSIDEIRANDYNLNIPRYVDSSEPTESWDLYASMFGGVPESELAAFARFWDALPSLRADLFSTTDGYSQVRVDDIRAAVEANADVQAFRQEVAASVADWPDSLHHTLITNAQELHLPTVHEALASELFERLSTVPLIDRYAAFQVLSDEWAVIEEDLEMLQSEGMGAATQVVPRMVAKKDSEVQDGWMGRIIPFDLVQSTILAKETARVSATSDRLSRVTSRMQDLLENLSEEDKANATVSDGGDSWVAKEVKAEAKLLKKEVRSGAHFDEDSYEMAVLTCADLIAEEAALKKEAKAAALALEEHTRATIENLSPAEVEDLLHRKWIAPMIEAISGMADAVVDDLTRGLSALVEKYSETFADVDAQIREAERELAAMLDDLTGSDADMRGIAEFKRLLGGAL